MVNTPLTTDISNLSLPVQLKSFAIIYEAIILSVYDDLVAMYLRWCVSRTGLLQMLKSFAIIYIYETIILSI